MAAARALPLAVTGLGTVHRLFQQLLGGRLHASHLLPTFRKQLLAEAGSAEPSRVVLANNAVTHAVRMILVMVSSSL